MRNRVIALACAVVVIAAGGTVVLLRTVSSTCAYPAPSNDNLPPILRSMGGFDQPQDPTAVIDLESNALSAATAVRPQIIGARATPPVMEAAVDNRQPNALVVPLTRATQSGSGVVALVAYLADCNGRAYYSAVQDLTAHPLLAFPSVSAAYAEQQLAARSVVLIFAADPFSPQWRDSQSGHTIPAI